jgi:hypothetical protein
MRALGTASLVASLASTDCRPATGVTAAEAPKLDVDADPLALLPVSAAVIASADAHAVFASSALGPSAGQVASALLPLADDAGFVATRDVDRVILATYAGAEADALAVISGRFDVARIAAATRTPSGAALTHGMYAGYTTDFSGRVTLVALSPKTLLAGTASRVYAALDRIGARQVKPWLSPAFVATMQTPGAQFAAVVDLTSNPITSATLGPLSLPWLTMLRVVRAIGDFNAPGVNFAATLTYSDPQQAEVAAGGLGLLDGWMTVLSPILGGARIHNLQVSRTGSDVSCKFAVDASSVATLSGLGTRFLPR